MRDDLRGRPKDLIVRIPDDARIASYGLRENRTLKGPGYFGEVSHKEDPDLYVTEMPIRSSVKDQFERAVLIPLVVPTLNRDELAHLVDGGDPTPDMIRKAVKYASYRRGQGKSPFAVSSERFELPVYYQERL